MAATSSASRMSVLPISLNRPPRGKSRSDASTNSLASESRTTSTPRPLVVAMKWCSNVRSREEAMWSSSRPSSRSVGHLAGLAVAKTSAPRCRASCSAAMPTPPVAAWISTDSPTRRPARSTRP